MVQFIIPVLCTPLLWIIRVLHHCTSKFYIPRFEAYLVSTRRGSGTSPCWWYTCWRFIDSSGFQMKQAECRNTPSSISMSHTENSGDELSSARSPFDTSWDDPQVAPPAATSEAQDEQWPGMLEMLGVPLGRWIGAWKLLKMTATKRLEIWCMRIYLVIVFLYLCFLSGKKLGRNSTRIGPFSTG